VTDFLLSFDLSVFRFVNGSLQNVVFDFLMPFLTDLNKNKPALAVILVALVVWFFKGGRDARLAILMLIPTILLSDQLNSSVIKFIIERPRPCHVLSDVHLLVSCGSGFSFPSSHAVNNFAGAVVLSFFVPRSAWGWFTFAAIVSFSRVYVGVHYPSDVVGGAVVGIACGGFIILLFGFVEKFLKSRHLKTRQR